MADIVYKIVGSFNRKIIHQKRPVLLLIDNAGCHPEDLRDKFSKVKVVFFPPNITSKLKPLRLGIIKNFKFHYRRYLLSYILASIETCVPSSEVAKTITILDAIRWISKPLRDVKPETISKCFGCAGVTPSAIAVGRYRSD
ncbi:PREDICTED: tigger transposable element-derived protein 1-like [Amphimedon queenslandica]|uniref:DDE-1 domain-containing protein n=1 Tax=Amphimedon queenslandica TaxID=400682 RepID=A0A1X7URR5_AMPQE|nr:PREDICTED: tigger transposable element-derived protein 1-like [Amphimedon queenslandica]|eukprot:XP_019852584.1 PREDICTED: tigger transposable element-derived protein 1-like [Amphimedon queenslandica]